ncbi:amidohydrolase family protein [Nocardia sp. NPDC050697]|uniref:amidohydrolase family protein n=1 Tax=Nocardia sp. NPDC050697 TaxID=3155158 RepID=UPI0034087FE2
MASDRIDVHQHLIPPVYRQALDANGIAAAGGRDLPDWSPQSAREMMAGMGIASAVLSVSTPGTAFLGDRTEAARLARAVNDYSAELAAAAPQTFGFFATLPMPDVTAAAAEAARALDTLGADGVVLLGNARGVYLGEEGQDALFEVLDDRRAVAFVHPADLPGPVIPGVLPFAADFLLDTTRAAYLLVRNGIRERYPNIRFVLSHGGGFVPYASHRMALGIFTQTGRSPLDVLGEFAGFYFDTALSSSAAALPTLLTFAEPGHVLFGSDWPFAPEAAVQYFEAGLAEYPGCDDLTRQAIRRGNASALFPRFGAAPVAAPEPPLLTRLRRRARTRVFRAVAKAANRR